jgi:hypothetical protein
LFNPNISKSKSTAKTRDPKSFPDEAILEERFRRLDELNAELDMDRHENEILDGQEEQGEDERDEHNRRRDERNNR